MSRPSRSARSAARRPARVSASTGAARSISSTTSAGGSRVGHGQRPQQVAGRHHRADGAGVRLLRGRGVEPVQPGGGHRPHPLEQRVEVAALEHRGGERGVQAQGVLQRGLRPRQLLARAGVVDGDGRVGGQAGQQPDLVVVEGALLPLGGEQRPEHPAADRERDAEQPAQALGRRRAVGRLLVRDPGLRAVVAGPHRLAGVDDPPDQPAADGQPDADQPGAAGAVGHHDPEGVVVDQREVGEVDAEQAPRLRHHLLEQVLRVAHHGQPLGHLVQRGQLERALAALGEQGRHLQRGAGLGVGHLHRRPGGHERAPVRLQRLDRRLRRQQVDPVGPGSHVEDPPTRKGRRQRFRPLSPRVLRADPGCDPSGSAASSRQETP